MDYRSRRTMPAHRRVSSTLSVSSRDDTPGTPVPTNITVSVRLKPGQPSQAAPSQSSSSPSWPTTATTIAVPDVGVFGFDNVFGPTTNSQQVFTAVAKPVVNAVVEGYHGTIFAYGMTGTGKTYSMRGLPSQPGIIPLAVADIFGQVSFATTTISVSYLEIYNEHVKDLLNPTVAADTLKLYDSPDSGLVRVRNLRCVRVATIQELNDLVSQGDLARRTEGTEYNAVSSRSHAVLQIFLEKSDPLTSATSTTVLSLCDLAGSERAAADIERRKEGAYINRSLLALGTIIARLSAASAGTGASASSAATTTTDSHDHHIPYRDSKLTRLLQHSLSGAALVSVLCTIDTHNPARHALAETVNTLRFAARAKNVAITPARAVATTAAATNSAAANAVIESLRLDLERERAETEIVKVELAEVRKQAYEHRIREQEKYDREKRELELQRDALKDRVTQLTRLILGAGPGAAGITSPDKPRATIGISAELDRYKTRVEELERKLAHSQITDNSTTTSAVSSSLSSPLSSSSASSSTDLLLQQKLHSAEAEIKELREYLADKDRMINALKRASSFATTTTASRSQDPAEHALRPLHGSTINIHADTTSSSAAAAAAAGGDMTPLANPKLRRSVR
ncbi:chromosome-associated kinesin [Lipomyces kononenkoae]|uniref:Chromosome-associated kinesin n=1 Tax=Lipomyces kononenkoae TaxID=34357 RepID=A0ACC3SWG8_LIPKO